MTWFSVEFTLFVDMNVPKVCIRDLSFSIRDIAHNFLSTGNRQNTKPEFINLKYDCFIYLH